jgi:hypothetical protein
LLAVDTETAVADHALLVVGGCRSPGLPAPLASTAAGAGTVSRALLLASLMVEPAGTVPARVAVQVALAPGVRLVGVQATSDTSTGACRLIVTVWELGPNVAVTVAV